jgi:Ca2+-binding RTX toxin-like protein
MLMLGGDGADRLFGGQASDRLEGGDKGDTLTGNGGKDVLIGGAGNDTLIGGAGRDGMRGGQGNDTFVYLNFSDSGKTRKGFDLIKGFGGGDLIDLSALDARAGGGDDAFTFLGNSTFTGAGGQLKIRTVGSKTFVLADIDGDKKFDFGIELENTTLDASDFIL